MERRRTPQLLEVVQVEMWVDANTVAGVNFVGCCPLGAARNGEIGVFVVTGDVKEYQWRGTLELTILCREIENCGWMDG